MLDLNERMKRGLELKGLAAQLDGLADKVLDELEPTIQLAVSAIAVSAIAINAQIKTWASAYGMDAQD